MQFDNAFCHCNVCSQSNDVKCTLIWSNTRAIVKISTRYYGVSNWIDTRHKSNSMRDLSTVLDHLLIHIYIPIVHNRSRSYQSMPCFLSIASVCVISDRRSLSSSPLGSFTNQCLLSKEFLRIASAGDIRYINGKGKDLQSVRSDCIEWGGGCVLLK